MSTHIPAGFTEQGAAPGWLIRKPTAMGQAIARVQAENAAIASENAELRLQLQRLMNRVESLEGNNGTETPE